MRAVLAVLVTACVFEGPPSVRPRTSYPTLEPDGRVGAAPQDPYAEPAMIGSKLRGIVGDHIPSDVEFGDPSAVTAMTVRVDSGAYLLPSHPNHQAIRDAGGNQRIAIHVGPNAAVTRAERADALRTTREIDTTEPHIKTAARDATSGLRTDRQKVIALVDFVYAHMTYVRADERVASVVLAKAAGDCTEFSLLFVALARASGIPAREVSGLAATEADGQPAFGFHAWAEVALDGHWVQVDPTWHEPVADATHVLLEENDLAAFGDAVEHLRVEVMDLKRDPHPIGHADVRQLTAELPSYMRLRRR